jgi:N-acetylmuramoyl-L-alanine amidase-like protein
MKNLLNATQASQAAAFNSLKLESYNRLKATQLIDSSVFTAVDKEAFDYGKDHAGTIAFAQAVAQFQKLFYITPIDGKLGLVTIGFLNCVYCAAGFLRLKGKEVQIPAPVNRTLTWTPGKGSYAANPKRERLDLGVIHWSETRTAHATYDVLVNRALSVDFAIDSDGIIYQFSDPADIVTYHAGVPGFQVNRRAWGVEMTWPGDGSFDRRPIPFGVTGPGFDPEEIVLGFTGAQTASLLYLIRAVCEAFDVPLIVNPSNKMDPSIRSGGFRGICGHFQITDQKPDPGFGYMALLGNLLRS